MILPVTTLAFGLVLSPLPRHAPAKALDCSRARRIALGWGPDPVWAAQKLASISDEADGLKAITIEAPNAAADFKKGGQYVQIREPGAEKAGIFAIASAPGSEGPMEFLIKEQPPSDWSPGTGWLTDASAGIDLEISQCMGPGFLKSDDALEGIETVMLFGVGSGISPLRSVIESGALEGKAVKLFYGARTPEMMSYTGKFDEWAKLGVEVTPVISKPEGTDWKGATGYVQDVAKAQGIDDPKSTAILLCGMKGMAEGVKELAAEVGIPEDRVMANF